MLKGNCPSKVVLVIFLPDVRLDNILPFFLLSFFFHSHIFNRNIFFILFFHLEHNAKMSLLCDIH